MRGLSGERSHVGLQALWTQVHLQGLRPEAEGEDAEAEEWQQRGQTPDSHGDMSLVPGRDGGYTWEPLQGPRVRVRRFVGEITGVFALEVAL